MIAQLVISRALLVAQIAALARLVNIVMARPLFVSMLRQARSWTLAAPTQASFARRVFTRPQSAQLRARLVHQVFSLPRGACHRASLVLHQRSPPRRVFPRALHALLARAILARRFALLPRLLLLRKRSHPRKPTRLFFPLAVRSSRYLSYWHRTTIGTRLRLQTKS